MQLCPVFVLPNKSLSVGAPRSRQNTRKSRPGPGGWGKLPSDGSPRAFRPPRSPGRRCRLHPKINSDSRSRPRLTPPRPHPSRPRGRSPDLPRCGRAGGSPRRPRPRAPTPTRAAPPPAAPRPRGACRWAQGAARPQKESGPGRAAAGGGTHGPAVTYRRLIVPRRLSRAPALTNCARKPRESPGSRAEPHSGPFKRGRARGPPGLLPLGVSQAPPNAGPAPLG